MKEYRTRAYRGHPETSDDSFTLEGDQIHATIKKKFLRKSTRRVTLSTSISVVLSLCHLFLRLTATPSPKVVPYSDLITSLHGGFVTKVQFEEGTRRIYYNTNLWSLKNAQTGEDNFLVPVESTIIIEKIKDIDIHKGGRNVFSKISKAESSTPV